MLNANLLNVKNFKKWILPILMFIFCEFIFKRKILPIFRKFVFTGDYFFDGILFDGLGYIFIILSVIIYKIIYLLDFYTSYVYYTYKKYNLL